MAMTDLQRSHAELRAAVILAGKEIRKLNFGASRQPRPCDSSACPAGLPRRRAKRGDHRAGAAGPQEARIEAEAGARASDIVRAGYPLDSGDPNRLWFA